MAVSLRRTSFSFSRFSVSLLYSASFCVASSAAWPSLAWRSLSCCCRLAASSDFWIAFCFSCSKNFRKLPRSCVSLAFSLRRTFKSLEHALCSTSSFAISTSCTQRTWTNCVISASFAATISSNPATTSLRDVISAASTDTTVCASAFDFVTFSSRSASSLSLSFSNSEICSFNCPTCLFRLATIPS